MRLRTSVGRSVGTAVAAAAVVVATAPAALASAPGLAAVALSERGHSLVALTTDEPGDTAPIGLIKGYGLGDTLLVGIDHHPRTGALVGVGDGGGIYRVDAGTAALTRIGCLTVPLDGRFFGVDVDPAANALRIVSDTGQNLRHPFTGTSDVPALTTVEDAPLDREGISGVAYTGSAHVFGVDTIADRLVAVGPSGDVTGLGEPGELGDLVGSAGLDIHTATTPDGTRDSAFAVVRRPGMPLLLAVDLADGTASRIGRFDIDVVDLAVVPAAEPAEEGTP
ncbi:DUF4394 domain-containing protein [Pseudonocardia sp.]|uniref:DUF4394 domain-containing protein n=1 Tax=Pseudonocardia sp. TaxID=60912 RepID=UPI003D0CEBE5